MRLYHIISTLILAAAVCSAQSLEIVKTLDPETAEVGEGVIVFLEFINPFGQELPITIVDRNVIGNNGVDIECLEHTLPADRNFMIKYEELIPYASGEYELDAAEITYTNPLTGNEETIRSDSPKIEITGSGTSQEYGITTVYRCGGTNMQSTSYSSSGSAESSMDRQQEEDASERMQNNQMNQDSESLKEEMEQQAEEMRQTEEQFKEAVSQNDEFKEAEESLREQGFEPESSEFDAEDNMTGSFEQNYTNADGEKATMKGEMENGEMKELMTQTDSERREIEEKFMADEKFRELNKSLSDEGFNMTEISMEQMSQDMTEIKAEYENSEGEKKEITAIYEDGKIEDVRIEGEKEEGFNIWFVFIVAAAIVAGFFAYRRYFSKTAEVPAIPVPVRPPDFREEAGKMLSEAERLFTDKKEKDAYEKISQAVRFYFSNTHNLKKELTNSELIRFLKETGSESLEKVRECLEMCGMVEFARHISDENVFRETLDNARGLICKV